MKKFGDWLQENHGITVEEFVRSDKNQQKPNPEQKKKEELAKKRILLSRGKGEGERYRKELG